MSEPVHVGRADEGSGAADVWRHDAGIVEVISDGRLILSPRGAGRLAELLERAAMPGQPPATGATSPTPEQVRRCDDSEDPNHQCIVCFDYAAGDYRPVRAAMPGQPGHH